MLIDDTVISAVTGHMNDDHADDSLLIARAFGYPQAAASRMASLDARSGTWRVTDTDGEHELVLPWPGGEVSERRQLRREVVMLYRAACAHLGIPAREEHAPEPGHPHGVHPHGAHPHDAGSAPHGHGSAEPPQGEGFAHRIRTATWGDHGDSEGATFMSDLMRGRGTLEDYVELVAQHHFMYEALERASEQLLEDPRLAGLHPVALRRATALDRDLTRLLGEDWRKRVVAVPATAAYAQRIDEVAEEGWVAGIIAHHYTRYLGDLSGGQAIARRMAGQFGLDGDGTAFYDFGQLGDLIAFKDAYRAVLDEYGTSLSEHEQARMLDEVRAAYRFNTAVFVDLSGVRAIG